MDFITLSYCRSPEDVQEARDFLSSINRDGIKVGIYGNVMASTAALMFWHLLVALIITWRFPSLHQPERHQGGHTVVQWQALLHNGSPVA